MSNILREIIDKSKNNIKLIKYIQNHHQNHCEKLKEQTEVDMSLIKIEINDERFYHQHAIQGRILAVPSKPIKLKLIPSDSIWVELNQKLQLSKYLISTDGRIKNLAGLIFGGKPEPCGYVRVYLTDDIGRRANFRVNRLVAMTFIDNPEGKPVVDHINRIKHDNRVVNLRWVTHRENIENRVRPIHLKGRKKVLQITASGEVIKIWKSAREAAEHIGCNTQNITKACNQGTKSKGFCWKYHFDIIPGEIWMKLTINGTIIDVSSVGRIRHANGRETYGSRTGAGYRSVHMRGKTYSVHRLVCLGFHTNPDSKPTVNHIDRNKENNNKNNLEWSTHREQGQHVTQTSIWKVVRQLTKTGEKVTEYKSLKEASEKTGINKGNICSVCVGNRKSAGGFKWEYAN